MDTTLEEIVIVTANTAFTRAQARGFNREESADFAQDCAVALLEAVEKKGLPRKPENYINRLVSNRLIDLYKYNARRTCIGEIDDVLKSQYVDVELTPWLYLKATLESANLSSREVKVAILLALGFTLREIAGAMGLSLASIHSIKKTLGVKIADIKL